MDLVSGEAVNTETESMPVWIFTSSCILQHFLCLWQLQQLQVPNHKIPQFVPEMLFDIWEVLCWNSWYPTPNWLVRRPVSGTHWHALKLTHLGSWTKTALRASRECRTQSNIQTPCPLVSCLCKLDTIDIELCQTDQSGLVWLSLLRERRETNTETFSFSLRR